MEYIYKNKISPYKQYFLPIKNNGCGFIHGYGFSDIDNQYDSRHMIVSERDFKKYYEKVVDYDYNYMIDALCEEWDIDESEAADFISYNTERFLGYMDNPPVIVHKLI